MARPTLSVIIPTLNEERYIGRLLADLAAQTQPPDEVVVVDGGSTDATVRIVRTHAGVRVHTAPRGVGRQRTAGGRIARGSMLYFLDADVRLTPDFIATTWSMFVKHTLDCACPRYVPRTTSWRVRVLFAVLNTVFWLGQQRFPAGAGPCIIVTKKLFTKLGGFRHTLLVDDLDFVYRAGTKAAFAQLSYPIHISDRRFRQFGFVPTLKQYLYISWLFIRRELPKSNTISYIFGSFRD